MARKSFITIVSAALLGGSFLVGGCSHQSESERMREEARRTEESAKLIERGEKMVREGKDMQLRGAELAKNGGDAVASQTLIAEGKAKQEQGEKLVQEARRMKAP